MKKIAILFFLICYLFGTGGFAMQIHYCGGRLAKIHLFTQHEDVGCKCGKKKMKKNCCKDDHYQFQIDDEQESGNTCDFSFKAEYALSFFLLPYLSDYISSNQSKVIPPYSKAPPSEENPIYLKNRVFLI